MRASGKGRSGQRTTRMAVEVAADGEAAEAEVVSGVGDSAACTGRGGTAENCFGSGTGGERGTEVLVLPAGMFKRTRNTSFYNVKQQTLAWRVEWIFKREDGDRAMIADERVLKKRH